MRAAGTSPAPRREACSRSPPRRPSAPGPAHPSVGSEGSYETLTSSTGQDALTVGDVADTRQAPLVSISAFPAPNATNDSVEPPSSTLVATSTVSSVLLGVG